jgi:hypothetical protein
VGRHHLLTSIDVSLRRALRSTPWATCRTAIPFSTSQIQIISRLLSFRFCSSDFHILQVINCPYFGRMISYLTMHLPLRWFGRAQTVLWERQFCS